jgi:hypothetical protein
MGSAGANQSPPTRSGIAGSVPELPRNTIVASTSSGAARSLGDDTIVIDVHGASGGDVEPDHTLDITVVALPRPERFDVPTGTAVPFVVIGQTIVRNAGNGIEIDESRLMTAARDIMTNSQERAYIGPDGELEIRLFAGGDEITGVAGLDVDGSTDSVDEQIEQVRGSSARSASRSTPSLVLSKLRNGARSPRPSARQFGGQASTACGTLNASVGGYFVPQSLVARNVYRNDNSDEVAYVVTAPTARANVTMHDSQGTESQIGAVVNFGPVEFSSRTTAASSSFSESGASVLRNRYRALRTTTFFREFALRCVDISPRSLGTRTLGVGLYSEWRPSSRAGLTSGTPTHSWNWTCNGLHEAPIGTFYRLGTSTETTYNNAAAISVPGLFGVNLSLGLNTRQAYKKTSRVTIEYVKTHQGSLFVCGQNGPPNEPNVNKVKTRGACMPTSCVPVP